MSPKRYPKLLQSTMSSILPSTSVTASPAVAVAPVKPKVGGIYQNIPFTGGPKDPLLARSFPLRPYMERNRGTIMKVWKACDNGIKDEFQLKKSAESDMHSFKTKVSSTLKSFGLDSVFYMQKNGQFV